jgi:hypothetical protein
MADNDSSVVVTQEMLSEACQAGDLERLQQWARLGVRVTTACPLCSATRSSLLSVMRLLVQELGAGVNHAMADERSPLILAAFGGDPATVLLLVQELGASVNYTMPHGETHLIVAALSGHLSVVRCLINFGAEINAADRFGFTALLASVIEGHFSTGRFLLEEGGANMEDVNNRGETIWDMLTYERERVAGGLEEEQDQPALTALLRVMVLRGAPPPALVDLLSPENARVVREGALLRGRLPAYLVWRRARLDMHFPLLLSPAPSPDTWLPGTQHRGVLGHGARQAY